MNKTEIINAIKEIYELETIGTDFDINKLDIAVESYDYYVKPGIQRMMFMKAFGKILCKKPENEMTPTDKLKQTFGMIQLIKSTFDKEYFDANVAVSEVPLNKVVVKNHLNSLSCKQLKEFITFVILGRLNYGLFISNVNSTDMWAELNERCVRKDSSIPRMDRADYTKLCPKDPLYCFDYLSKRVIVDIFCNHIDKDAALMEVAVVAYRNSGLSGLRDCVNAELQRRRLVGAAKDIFKAKGFIT